MKLTIDPFNSIKVSAVKLVSFIIKQSKIMIAVQTTYLKDTSEGQGQLSALNSRFLHYSLFTWKLTEIKGKQNRGELSI